MKLPEAPVRLFRKALMLWVLLFTFFSWTGFEAVNVLDRSPQWLPTEPLKHITHALPQMPDAEQTVFLLILPWVIIVLASVELWRPSRWWRAALVWWFYVNVMYTAWLTGSGGQQLMANVLFWSIFLAMRSERAQFLGLWAIRLQLLLAYLATGLHKLTGTHWLDGTAMGIAATDQAYGPAWLASTPVLSTIITWSVLLFQLSFPIAIWFRTLRLPWMLFGMAFHLGTAIWMDIPEMGLAFVVCYVIWLDDDQIKRIPVLRRFAAGASMLL